MGVSDRVRKILWVSAGGRCSICRCQLITEGTESDDPSVFGEEAHIVARSPGGPRADEELLGDINGYDNLILLCSKHHKQVDDQRNHFTVERLREIKRKHEEWNASLDGAGSGPKPMKLIPDPSHPEPRLLKLIVSGNALWSMIEECKSFAYSRPDHLPEDHEDLIVDFLDSVKDWADIAEDLGSIREKRDAAKDLGAQINVLAEAGYVVGAKMRHMLLTGGGFQEPWTWPMLVVEVQPAALARIEWRDKGDQETAKSAQGEEAAKSKQGAQAATQEPRDEPDGLRSSHQDLIHRAEEEVRRLERELFEQELSARGGPLAGYPIRRQLEEAKKRLARIDPTSPLLF